MNRRPQRARPVHSWQDQVAHYADQGREKDKSGEDKIARRVLRSLGMTNAEKGLALYEKQFSDGVQHAVPFWIRVSKIVNDCLSMSSFPRRPHVVALCDHGRTAIILTANMLVESGTPPVIFAMKGDDAIVFTAADTSSLASVPPPYEALARLQAEGYTLIAQPVAAFADMYLVEPFRRITGGAD
jgi:hypothetical protein